MLIVSQIISMQFLFYSSLLIFNYLLNEFVNLANFSGQIVYSLDQIFDYRLLNLKNAHNSFVCFSFFFNSILRLVARKFDLKLQNLITFYLLIYSSFFIWRIVNRSKQCLDFTVTVYVYHIVICWIYVGSFPSSLSFWLVVVLCATAMTILSEYLCMRSALKEIPLSMAPKTNL